MLYFIFGAFLTLEVDPLITRSLTFHRKIGLTNKKEIKNEKLKPSSRGTAHFSVQNRSKQIR